MPFELRLVPVPVFVLMLAVGGRPSAGGLIARAEVLRLAFPDAAVVAERVFLTEEQQQRAADLAGVDVPSALIARYVARRGDTVVGRAYVDTHVVRTKRESLLIVLGPGGHVRRVDVTALLEPPEYEAPSVWLRQYQEQALHDDLRLERSIRPIAGATLTARAVNDAVRRVLAIDRVLEADAPVEESQ